jgi:hypothetical protein
MRNWLRAGLLEGRVLESRTTTVPVVERSRFRRNVRKPCRS